jgi:hypothetical protein
MSVNFTEDFEYGSHDCFEGVWLDTWFSRSRNHVFAVSFRRLFGEEEEKHE